MTILTIILIITLAGPILWMGRDFFSWLFDIFGVYCALAVATFSVLIALYWLWLNPMMILPAVAVTALGLYARHVRCKRAQELIDTTPAPPVQPDMLLEAAPAQHLKRIKALMVLKQRRRATDEAHRLQMWLEENWMMDPTYTEDEREYIHEELDMIIRINTGSI